VGVILSESGVVPGRFDSKLIDRVVAAAGLAPSSQSNRFPVSFSRLFSALFYGGEWQQWCHAIGQETRFDFAQLVPLGGSNETPAEPLRASISARRILETAQNYASRAQKATDVHHVIAAYCFDPAGHEQQLAGWNFDRVFWGNALVDEVARRFPEEAEVFRQLRDETFPTTPIENAPAENDSPNVAPDDSNVVLEPQPPKYNAWSRPHIDNDRVGGAIPEDRDLLDARKPALRFAKLLVAKDVAPPIALGLFGNWGSGKTFFMGLMRDRIEQLSKTGGAQYVRGVAQIEFNAWHYHDTNLWASLALRIFEGLAEKLGGRKESDVERARRELHQRINSSDTRRKEADALRTSALERRAKAAGKLEELRSNREALRADAAQMQRVAAWRVVTSGESFRALREAAIDLATHFGIPNAYASVEQVRQLKRDVEDTRAHGFGVLTAIGRRFRGVEDSTQTIVVLALLLAGALGIGWIVDALGRAGDANLPAFTATIVQVSTLVTAIAAWCGRRVRELRDALDRIGAVEAELAEAEAKVEPDEEMLEIEKQIAGLDQEIHAKTEEVSAAEREIAEATAEIDRINRGGLVYDFLQDRRAAANYVGQLGLISTIRQDFEKLDGLLRDFAKNAKDAQPIERIVLYIDDLDRCHPDKVVEVLQAVHLLLAFPLFNVVVGVDARWLERSLRRQYVGRAGGARAQAEDPFSPQDYLEKIFQIPYALSRMDRNGFASLIGGMIETRSEWSAKQAEREMAPKPLTLRDSPAPRASSDLDTAPMGEDSAPPVLDNDADGEEAQLVADTAPQLENASADALYFEDCEQQFIANLYEFIDRPRLAKRFVNIYRLLRVRADDEGESETFLDPANGEHRAALTLLAIHVGHPSVAGKLMQRLQSFDAARSWREFVESLTAEDAGSSRPPAQERDELRALQRKLAELSAATPEALDAYRKWAPRVGCFSFDWHRPEAALQRSAR